MTACRLSLRVLGPKISGSYQRPELPAAHTSDEAPSEVNTLKVVFLGVHVAVTCQIKALGRKHPKQID